MSFKRATNKPAHLIKFPTLSSAPQVITQIIQHASAQHKEKRHAQRSSSKKFEKCHDDSDSYEYEAEEISTDSKKHKKLPIRQRRRRRRVLEKQSPELPRLTFCGTLKFCGVNAVIVRTEVEDGDGDGNKVVVGYQSKTRNLTPEKDLEGFAVHFARHEGAVKDLFEGLDETNVTRVSKRMRRTAVFGRWCKTSISRNVESGAHEEERRFVVFAVRRFQVSDCSGSEQATGGEWLDIASLKKLHNAEARISNVFRFQTWEVEVDFSDETILQRAQEQIARHTQSISNTSSDNQYSEQHGQAQGIFWRVTLRENQSEEDKTYMQARFWFGTSASCDLERSGEQTEGKSRRTKEVEKAPMCQNRNVEKLLQDILPTSRLDQALQILQQQQQQQQQQNQQQQQKQQKQSHTGPHAQLSPTQLASYISALKTTISTSTDPEEKAKIEKARVDVQNLMEGVEARAKWWFRGMAKREREIERREIERERREDEEESEVDRVCFCGRGYIAHGDSDTETDTESDLD